MSILKENLSRIPELKYDFDSNLGLWLARKIYLNRENSKSQEEIWLPYFTNAKKARMFKAFVDKDILYQW